MTLKERYAAGLHWNDIKRCLHQNHLQTVIICIQTIHEVTPFSIGVLNTHQVSPRPCVDNLLMDQSAVNAPSCFAADSVTIPMTSTVTVFLERFVLCVATTLHCYNPRHIT